MHAQLDKLQTAFKKIKFMKYVLGAHSKGATGDSGFETAAAATPWPCLALDLFCPTLA